ncbi:MAG: tRNA sulfurtransferase [Myxococcota bacterium]
MGKDATTQLVLLRFSGDITIKARATRHQFVRRLIHNLRDAITAQGLPPRVRMAHNRIFVELPAGAAVEPLTRVFGVQTLSRVEARPAGNLEEIVASGLEIFGEAVRGKRFAVRARRVGDRQGIPLRSADVERELGTALLPASAGVHLGDPEFTAFVELIDGEAYFFPERLPAEGGLPLGVEGQAVTLMSGGFDSAVAAWQLLRRGVAQDYVFCNLGGASHRMGALRVAKALADDWHYGHHPYLPAIDFEAVVNELREKTTIRYWQVLLKRLMVRAAAEVARERRAPAIVTGEAVGQVSSQTLQNLSVISRATDHMILRPLVGTNKDEIIRLAEHIGTFELSKVVGEYCDLVPRKPATAATLDAIEAEEARLDLRCLEQAIAQRRRYDLRELRPEDLTIPDLETERIPERATVIDLRGRPEYESWHYPEALRLDFARALEAFPSFERNCTYVLYCDYGLMSAHVAELMRKQGFDALHFKGGTRTLRKLTS